jgi:hypothetical protein
MTDAPSALVGTIAGSYRPITVRVLPSTALASGPTRPANYAPPTASRSPVSNLGRARLEAEHVNDTRPPIDLQQQNIYLYIELDH